MSTSEPTSPADLVDRLLALIAAPTTQQVFANGPDRFFYVDTNSGPQHIAPGVLSPEVYEAWTARLVACTDIGQEHSLADSPLPVIEGSFLKELIPVAGSLHVATKRLTRTFPAVTVRKQPEDKVTLDQMVAQRMMTPQMANFLAAAMRARLNILLSGGSGAGKTTMARALSLHIPTTERICTAEEIDELNVGQHLPNTVAMTTWKSYDELGQVMVEVTLEQLVRETLRMRPDRIWVGETRGKEAYALVKACNSGHDGSLTTVHGDTGAQAVKQLVSYVMESHLTEAAAIDQVAKAFHLVIQIVKPNPMKRFVAEIVELESVTENGQQRRNPLFEMDGDGSWKVVGQPTTAMVRAAERYGVDLVAEFGPVTPVSVPGRPMPQGPAV